MTAPREDRTPCFVCGHQYQGHDEYHRRGDGSVDHPFVEPPRANVTVDDEGVPTYVIPADAIPNGGYVLVNGVRCFFPSEERMREREEWAKAELAKMHARSAGWILRRLFRCGKEAS
jgi:hypothetical protein